VVHVVLNFMLCDMTFNIIKPHCGVLVDSEANV